MMERILVGVDGSAESRHAAEFAATLAKATGAQLIIASAVAPRVAFEVTPEIVTQGEEWAEIERARVSASIKALAVSLDAGRGVETLSVDGPAAEALSELARTAGADLLVVGHRGRNAVARALLGSVADRLVQISPKPVLVVR